MRIFRPMRMRTMPPAMVAGFSKREPNWLPTTTPTSDSTKVVTPMIAMATQMFTPRKANVMPTAKASMLVAMASMTSSR